MNQTRHAHQTTNRKARAPTAHASFHRLGDAAPQRRSRRSTLAVRPDHSARRRGGRPRAGARRRACACAWPDTHEGTELTGAKDLPRARYRRHAAGGRSIGGVQATVCDQVAPVARPRPSVGAGERAAGRETTNRLTGMRRRHACRNNSSDRCSRPRFSMTGNDARPQSFGFSATRHACGNGPGGSVSDGRRGSRRHRASRRPRASRNSCLFGPCRGCRRHRKCDRLRYRLIRFCGPTPDRKPCGSRATRAWRRSDRDLLSHCAVDHAAGSRSTAPSDTGQVSGHLPTRKIKPPGRRPQRCTGPEPSRGRRRRRSDRRPVRGRPGHRAENHGATREPAQRRRRKRLGGWVDPGSGHPRRGRPRQERCRGGPCDRGCRAALRNPGLRPTTQTGTGQHRRECQR
jgi:hypothetical protein